MINNYSCIKCSYISKSIILSLNNTAIFNRHHINCEVLL